MGVSVSTVCQVDVDHLLRLRLVVARFGEMDRAGWWNTQGMLSEKGVLLLGRGLPKTHFFAQARVVFEVARQRCQDVYDLPDAVTLWNLPAVIEEKFDDQWHDWLDNVDGWRSFFQKVATSTHDNLADMLLDFGLLSAEQKDAVAGLRRTADGRALPLRDVSQLDAHALTLLAAGFSRGERGRLTVPFIRREDLAP